MKYVAASRDDRALLLGKVHLVTEDEARRYLKKPDRAGRKRYLVHALCSRGVAFPVFEDWGDQPEDIRCQGCVLDHARRLAQESP